MDTGRGCYLTLKTDNIMSTLFWLLLPVAVAAGVADGLHRGRSADFKATERLRAYRLSLEAQEETDRSADVWRVLMAVYTRLRQAGASLRVPWITGCIQAIEQGRGCPPDVAIAALVETGEELAGSRWDSDTLADVFADAARELAEM